MGSFPETYDDPERINDQYPHHKRKAYHQQVTGHLAPKSFRPRYFRTRNIIFKAYFLNYFFHKFNKFMVPTGLEKSLKKYHVFEKSLKVEKLWDILEKSLNFPQKALNVV